MDHQHAHYSDGAVLEDIHDMWRYSSQNACCHQDRGLPSLPLAMVADVSKAAWVRGTAEGKNAG